MVYNFSARDLSFFVPDVRIEYRAVEHQIKWLLVKKQVKWFRGWKSLPIVPYVFKSQKLLIS